MNQDWRFFHLCKKFLQKLYKSPFLRWLILLFKQQCYKILYLVLFAFKFKSFLQNVDFDGELFELLQIETVWQLYEFDNRKVYYVYVTSSQFKLKFYIHFIVTNSFAKLQFTFFENSFYKNIQLQNCVDFDKGEGERKRTLLPKLINWNVLISCWKWKNYYTS